MYSQKGPGCGVLPLSYCKINERVEDSLVRFILLLSMEVVSKHWKNKRRLQVNDNVVGGILLVNWGEKKQGRGGAVRAFEDDKEKGYGF